MIHENAPRPSLRSLDSRPHSSEPDRYQKEHWSWTPSHLSTLLPNDRALAEQHGVVAIDCSWERIDKAFTKHFPGNGRRLPTLLASNPVNYAKPHKLSSAEALAAALYIMGFKEMARDLLDVFKWGGTFLTLNHEPLESYASVKSLDDMTKAQSQFF